MARPIKEGLDYFELDCVMEDNIKLLQVECGLKGFALVIKLYQKIYGGKGYYCEWNEDVLLLFASENGESIDFIKKFIEACFKRKIFSEEMYTRYGILTSTGIQKRYFRAVSRREPKTVNVDYILIELPLNEVSVDNNSTSSVVSVDNNSINVDDNTQRREEKKREEKKRKDKTKKDKTIQDKNRQDKTNKEERREENLLPFGWSNNVYLTQSEYDDIQERFLYGDGVINITSQYLANTDKEYKNHYTLCLKIGKEETA